MTSVRAMRLKPVMRQWRTVLRDDFGPLRRSFAIWPNNNRVILDEHTDRREVRVWLGRWRISVTRGGV